MNLAKRLVRRVLEGAGYTVFKAPPEVVPGPTFTPVDVFPLAVAELMSRKENIFFLQVGAHDGLTYDPMRLFVEQYRWRGILLEPQPRVFRQLVANYDGMPGLIFENVAAAPVEGEVTLYTFAEGGGLPAHATQLASFQRDALLHNGHGYKGEILETRVPTVTISSLLKKHNVSEVDILQIDTEGFDFEVIKMIDFSEIKPSIINYESVMLSAADQNACIALLTSHGYRIAPGFDTVAILQGDYRETLRARLESAMQTNPVASVACG